jgi:predicted glycoside hydrolase/deacetylase ChbG (UPF0249 family)
VNLRRTLVTNADDFGFTHDVNAGIIEAHGRGILTATTLMANGAAFDDAVRLARANPTLDVGCHLVLVQGRSLAGPEAELPETLSALLAALARRRIRVYEELEAQVTRVLDAGLRPTHLDTHKHTHLLPPVLDAVARLGERFGIPFVRQPFDFPMRAGAPGIPWSKLATARGLGLLRGRFQAALRRCGCRATDHFAGFAMTGRFRTAELAALIRELPPGSTEFMCHPGRCGDELRSARTRLKESREAELDALVAPETREALAEAGVELTNYRALATMAPDSGSA